MSTHIRPNNGRLVVDSLARFSDLSNADAYQAALHVKGDTFLSSDLHVDGTLVVNGDVISLGNSGGNVTFNSNIASDIEPSVTDTYDIGASNFYWQNIYVNQINLSSSPSSDINAYSSLCLINSTSNTSQILDDKDNGTVKTIIVTEPLSQSVIITPNSTHGFSNITFNNHGDSITLVFVSGAWNIVSNFRASVS